MTLSGVFLFWQFIANKLLQPLLVLHLQLKMQTLPSPDRFFRDSFSRDCYQLDHPNKNKLASGIKYHIYCNLFFLSCYVFFHFFTNPSMPPLSISPRSPLLSKWWYLPSFDGLIIVGPDSKSSIDLLKNQFGVKPTKFNFRVTR